MDANWSQLFRSRMREFESRRAHQQDALSVSIKVRVTSGCFHREHSPAAYKLIDTALSSFDPEVEAFSFEEHESGPEILVYAALATAGISLAKSVIDLITTIIKSRAEGIKDGDHPSDPLELIVRRIDTGTKVIEETVLRIKRDDNITTKQIETLTNKAVNKLASTKVTKNSKKRTRR